MSELSKTASTYDFDKLSNSEYLEKGTDWSARTMFEYYLKSNIVNDTILVKAITNAIKAYEYKVKVIDLEERSIIGQRGIKANEWKSVVGIYYRTTNISSDIYVKVRITQDATGGWKQDRAKEIGELICRILKQCTKAYPIRSQQPS